jgi:CheY-like chemotaxis protein/MinD-like ATPase involved in chromosome partitioning or flagellar assembly
MKRVLIVDDDPNICKLLEFSLQQAGLAVLIAQDGGEGLALAREHAPDVAILDIMMPSMHGYELCRRLRADRRTAGIKILFLTARSQPIDEQEAMKAGADLFVAKPVIPDELVERVQTLVYEAEREAAAPPPRPSSTPVAETLPIEGIDTGSARLVACLGPTPGTGVTTVAINLALAFAAWQRSVIPLADLGGAPGSVLESLGIEGEAQQRGLPSGDVELSWETLAPHLVAYRAGLCILPSPAAENVPPALTHQAVSLLCRHYPLVIADAGHSLNARSAPILLSADLILLVTSHDAQAMQALPGTLEGLREQGYPNRQILAVINNLEPQTRASLEEMRAEIARPILAVIPFEPAMRYTQRTQRPLLAMNPRSPASQAIGRLTMQLARGLQLEKAAG